MASGFISRLLPVRSGSQSIYDTIQQHEEDEDHFSDYEGHTALAIDEQNLGQQFHDLDLEAAHFNLSESHVTAKSNLATTRAVSERPKQTRQPKGRLSGRRKGRRESGLLNVEEADDEVPASLLVEDGENLDGVDLTGLPPRPEEDDSAIPAIRSPSPSTRHHWETTRTQQQLHLYDSANLAPNASDKVLRGLPGLAMAHPREKAMWRWANVENLDNFLQEVYLYYLGNGIWSILLSRCLNLL